MKPTGFLVFFLLELVMVRTVDQTTYRLCQKRWKQTFEKNLCSPSSKRCKKLWRYGLLAKTIHNQNILCSWKKLRYIWKYKSSSESKFYLISTVITTKISVRLIDNSLRVTLVETGSLHDFLGIFSTRDEKYHFHKEGSMRGEIEPTRGEIETHLGNGRWGEEIETNIGKLGNSENSNFHLVILGGTPSRQGLSKSSQQGRVN